MVELRPATSLDHPFLEALYASGRASEMANWGWPDAQCRQFAAMQYLARCRHYDAVHPGREDSVILVDGTEAGLLSVARRPAGITIVDIAILPEFQGRGVGGGLVRELQQEAARSGKTLGLHVLAENRAAERLYQSLGFACVADDGVYHRLEWRPETAQYLPSQEKQHV
ncbi:MAG: GNAT family N-acetyltransferase [Geobacteraceae bacterium]|nr:GNAT family N-acetyltransferase [Geobacteraceae bacterium]